MQNYIQRVINFGFRNVLDKQLAFELALGKSPLVVAQFPYARGNPGNRLLYKQAAHNDIISIPVQSLDDLMFKVHRGSYFVHLHWVNDFFSESFGARGHEQVIDKFISTIDKLKDFGWEVFWTSHNIFPHVCSQPHYQS